MFNDRYGLTRAVLDGQKTMTRRVISTQMLHYLRELYGDNTGLWWQNSVILPGETVAIAQSYKESGLDPASEIISMLKGSRFHAVVRCEAQYHPGWTNKMFVKADLMPHKIHITSVHVERLQDITEEDAMCEGVFKYDMPPLHHESDMYSPWPPHEKPYKFNNNNHKYFCNARSAFSYLINKVSGRGTWKSNPYVFVYSFKLINQS